MFQKVGSWLADQSERFIRGEARSSGSYYGSSEAEQVYGQMGAQYADEAEEAQETMEDTGRHRAVDPFDRAGKDYGGRVPYRSQRDIQAQQAALEAERLRQLRQEQAKVQTPQPGYGGYPQQPQGAYAQVEYPQQPPQGAYAGPPQGGYASPQNGYAPQPQGGYAQQPQAGYPQGGYPQQQPPAAAPRQAHRTQAQGQPDSNVVLFPGMQQAPNGNAYAHVEFVVLLKNRNECTKVIEFIRSNASVFLNMEFIASDSERQRCVDTLTGAAYTLGCQLLKISPRFFYLISPPSVHVVIDPAMQKFSAGSEAYAARPTYETDYGTQRFGGYPPGGYAQASGQMAPQPTERFSAVQPPSGYGAAQQPTARRTVGSFGSVMAGATGSYPGVSAFQRSGGTATLQKEYP
ncbi:MAG: cell division protein SepF [Candidatus Limiplasma sp.]|nr:cell division protein SepF [Candidatus Limiplasma sp.]